MADQKLSTCQKGSRVPAGFYASLFTIYDDECFKAKYKPKTKPVVMGTDEVERVVAKRLQGKSSELFVE